MLHYINPYIFTGDQGDAEAYPVVDNVTLKVRVKMLPPTRNERWGPHSKREAQNKQRLMDASITFRQHQSYFATLQRGQSITLISDIAWVERI